MASDISKIEVIIWTAKGEKTGTSDNVFLGLGGREFRLKTDTSNFTSGKKDVFILGIDHNISKSDWNNPNKPKLDTDDLDLPIYIRKGGTLQGADDDGWKIEKVEIKIPLGDKFLKHYKRLDGPDDIWLSNNCGLILFLKWLPPLLE